MVLGATNNRDATHTSVDSRLLALILSVTARAFAMDILDRTSRPRRRPPWLWLVCAAAIVVFLVVMRAPLICYPCVWLVLASGVRAHALKAGGSCVAMALGGTPVNRRSGGELERRLVSVVHELARTAAIPTPHVFVLRHEPAINVFVVGRGPLDAAVGVTAGALQRFEREELAALLGRELNHLILGRTSFDRAVIAGLHGLFAPTTLGYRLLSQANDSGSDRHYACLTAGLLLILLGGLPLVLARVTQGALSRRRVYRADATTEPLNGRPLALRQALLKIVDGDRGGLLRTPEATAAAHLFFVPPDASWISRVGVSLLTTHPPIAQRIKLVEAQVDPVQIAAPIDIAQTPLRKRFVMPEDALPLFGSIAEIANLDSLQKRLPKDQQRRIARVSVYFHNHAKHARALFFAALLPEQLEGRRLALEYLARISGAAMLHAVTRANTALVSVPPIAQLPLLISQLSALDQLSASQRTRFLATVKYMTRDLSHATMLRYCLRRLLVQGVFAAVAESQLAAKKLTNCAQSVGTLLAVLAAAGHGDSALTVTAYEAGISNLLPSSVRPTFQVPGDDWPGQLDAALEELRALHPVGRQDLVEGLALTIAHDGMLVAPEAELLRTVCLVIGTAMPTLNDAAPVLRSTTDPAALSATR